MKSLTEIVFVFFILATVVVFLKYRTHFSTETFSAEILGKPNLWWIVDSETNSRNWWDFGARNSSVPNKGYLKVALNCAMKTQSGDFTIHIIPGRQAVTKFLTENGMRVSEKSESMPASVWRQWAIANILALKGGLAMMGDSTLCIGPSFGQYVLGVDAATCGIYPNEASALPGSEMVGPAPWVGWSSRPFHPGWKYAAEKWNLILNAGPTAWTAADARRENLSIWAFQKTMNVSLLQDVEGGRNPDGSERTLEDLFARTSKPVDPKTIIDPGTVYVPFDGDALVRTYRYAWFVRMSEQQIIESDFVWAALAKKVLIG